ICDVSTAFHSAYCQAPICGPSRSSFMSGKTPHQLGIFDNSIRVFENIAAEDMWPAKMKQNGYYCSSGGKMHHKYKALLQDHHDVLYNDARKRFDDDMKPPKGAEMVKHGGWRNGWATADPKDDDTYYDHQSADSAIQFLKEYCDDKPFYREVGFFSPHVPHITPTRFKGMYDRRKLKQPPEWADGFDTNTYADTAFPQNVDPQNPKWWRLSVRNYYAAMSHGDHHLGRVWDALQKSRHAKNTIVIVVSDHGFHLGNLNRYKKTTVWEQAASVPIIIHDPAKAQADVVNDPVALLDVGPTVLDYAGIAPPQDCVGKSMRPLVEGATDPDRSVPTFYFDNASMRIGDYRLIRYDDGSIQFYNIKNDHWQLKNLGENDPAFPECYKTFVDICATYGYSVPA
ncbi:MAG: sulfatase-like hydrolase/transferase, partial [Planktomarina sp.]